MSLTTMMVAFAMAQATPVSSDTELLDVAYSELARGDADAAVRKLELGGAKRYDPAVLINLGAAYARQGAADKALAAFRAAMDTPDRYDLELADGSWLDSREAARRALADLQRTVAQAKR